jgi:flagellar basal-body rod modification protein FlgD
MTVSAVTAAASTTSVKSSSQSLAANFDNFLKLLTTQLQNQDPLAPMDANAFTSQLVQFASVEQAIATNTKLGELGKLIQNSGTASAMGMLGQQVSAGTDKIGLAQSGGASIRYRLPEAAAKVQVTVLDDHGRTVRSFPGGSAAGENLVRWDGTDNSAARAPAGTYTVRVEAARADGTKVDASQFVIGTVQGIEPNGSDLQLVVDGTSVPMSAVRNISRPV